MRRPLVLTGGPAAGKTTCGRLLAAARPRGAFVDVDDVRQLVVGGHAAPWSGPEGVRQQLLGVGNACLLARRFLAAGFEVVLADVVTPRTAALYRAHLDRVLLVHLRLPLATAQTRARHRLPGITDTELTDLHGRDQTDPPTADAVLSVGELSLAAQVAAVESAWANA